MVYIDMVMDTAKLFKNGRSQAVRLPKEYRFPGKQVYLRKVGKGVLLLPEEGTWDALIEGASQFSADFLNERDQGKSQQREGLFEE
jgi:antitoxin VapB